jgi:hypothetical protein
MMGEALGHHVRRTPRQFSKLTETVCWSRMQAEAGQELPSIIERKELERRANGGIYFWGVGNAPARAVSDLAYRACDIDVVFSVMKTRPRRADTSPTSVVVWRSYVDHWGDEHSLPPGTLVTSKGGTVKFRHYALVCQSSVPLSLGDLGLFDPSAYRNVSEAKRPIGASQVTALVQRVSRERTDAPYPINLRAKLALGFWVKLSQPLELTPAKRAVLDRSTSRIQSQAEWLELVAHLRTQRRYRPVAPQTQLRLL